jgi:copper chaperone NosL
MNGVPKRRSQWGTVFLSMVLIFCLFLSTKIAGAADRELPKPAAKDKCPVCGMFVAKYPDWTMIVLFEDGSNVFFDGPKDMFKYLFDMKRYDPSRKAEDIRAVMVRDYYRLSYIDAHKAWYVLGSDIYGPMGRELIPLEREADAREFQNDHQGKKMLRFPEITREVIKTLE